MSPLQPQRMRRLEAVLRWLQGAPRAVVGKVAVGRLGFLNAVGGSLLRDDADDLSRWSHPPALDSLGELDLEVAGTRTTRYRAVPPKIDCRRSIEGEIDRRRSIEGEINHRWSIEREKGKKKKKKKRKRRKKEKRRRRKNT
ncbi:hypothetical protein B296_00051698 [Ensete ventricosum]|uniref:Uncharacterized protein n=1 Tax=Ensete ventricosum TaxID=4639 RepID=A0A426X8K2_ENSVE|nr:hypothetical protein B296_00051698 [Ensete ventricosum]